MLNKTTLEILSKDYFIRTKHISLSLAYYQNILEHTCVIEILRTTHLMLMLRRRRMCVRGGKGLGRVGCTSTVDSYGHALLSGSRLRAVVKHNHLQ